jgi:hypothetical protein
MSLTLKDFEIRYINIRKAKPNVKNCSVKGCHNPRDSTEGMGEDTCCAYHRLLFDFWSVDVDPMMRDSDGFQKRLTNQKARRTAFTRWRNTTGKETCDNIVLRMALEPINWKC